MRKIPGLSVFFPAYNEEGNIKSTVEKAMAILPGAADKYELIIVDDGSKDKTGEIAESLA
ncbi:glycosyltransferase, partial [Candidatus Shapirobacteria bacterium]|nr:glycosyltransferase [Candidatus Shapirobacteria bacterium]